jgi:hypothetical protein
MLQGNFVVLVRSRFISLLLYNSYHYDVLQLPTVTYDEIRYAIHLLRLGSHPVAVVLTHVHKGEKQ